MTPFLPDSAREALLYKKLSRRRAKCGLCPHGCIIGPGETGMCRARKNSGGILYAESRALGSVSFVDPVEKKPFYHFLPGSKCYSVGASGCTMRCRFCINWQLSQNGKGNLKSARRHAATVEKIVSDANNAGCRSIAYTYNEPLVHIENVIELAKRSRESGLKNIIKTNGFITPKATAMLVPFLDAANVDLKAFNEESYRKMGGRLRPVLTTLRLLKAMNIWIEVTTVVVPGHSDGVEELSDMAGFIVDELGKETPWHIHRFFPEYRMKGACPTPLEMLERAMMLGNKAGLEFVYLSNLALSGKQNTICPGCDGKTIIRKGFSVTRNTMKIGKCKKCTFQLPGRWGHE